MKCLFALALCLMFHLFQAFTLLCGSSITSSLPLSSLSLLLPLIFAISLSLSLSPHLIASCVFLHPFRPTLLASLFSSSMLHFVLHASSCNSTFHLLPLLSPSLSLERVHGREVAREHSLQMHSLYSGKRK